ncbi:hypothetical protein HGRIS_010738 [Hohenbuehelia grisea]|uniref:Uncharacterized protein n=1 Tax=Hohenbuehelia grisea TaxID=104357 RepID=A0ABR3IXN3_9AGAR
MEEEKGKGKEIEEVEEARRPKKRARLEGPTSKPKGTAFSVGNLNEVECGNCASSQTRECRQKVGGTRENYACFWCWRYQERCDLRQAKAKKGSKKSAKRVEEPDEGPEEAPEEPGKASGSREGQKRIEDRLEELEEGGNGSAEMRVHFRALEDEMVEMQEGMAELRQQQRVMQEELEKEREKRKKAKRPGF